MSSKPISLTQAYARYIKLHVADWPDDPGVAELNEMLRTLGKWRSQMVANTLVAREGARVRSGPFAGMEYLTVATEGAIAPRLFGTYESELHPHLAAFAAEGLECVIDVGCAEGYYAVGLARMLPEATVYAYDIDEKARIACADLAARNGVTDRVVIGGEFAPADFERFAGRRSLVMVDTEGAEVDILQPVPALAQMRIIVETHDVYRPGAMKTLVERFSPTHDIVRVDLQAKALDLPNWLAALPHLDHLIAVWEWRAAPTPWLVMTPKAG
jgi:precorrin-6B methylase 2